MGHSIGISNYFSNIKVFCLGCIDVVCIPTIVVIYRYYVLTSFYHFISIKSSKNVTQILVICEKTINLC